MEGAGEGIKENDKKNHEREILQKKSFTPSSLENSCIEIPKHFTEILATRTRIKNTPSFLASVQSGSSFKMAFQPVNFLFI